jgi:hypothetical protein
MVTENYTISYHAKEKSSKRSWKIYEFDWLESQILQQ